MCRCYSPSLTVVAPPSRRRKAPPANTVEIAARLRELLGVDAVLTDPATIAPYLTDFRSNFQGKAAAVVQPSDVESISRLLRWCNAQQVPVVPQGGNTGYCGGATPDNSGNSIVLSLRRLNRVRHIDPENFAMVAEAGCTLAAVQAAATAAQRFFPLSLGSEGSCQIGGNLATNAGGTAVLRYGMMRDLTLGVEAVFADGAVYSQLSPLRKDNTGYDLKNLLIGSEGTLGVITAACLRLFPQPRQVATAWVAVPSPQAAITLLSALHEASADRVSSCELVPLAALELVKEHIPLARDPQAALSPWYVLVELSDSGGTAIDPLLSDALTAAAKLGLVTDAVVAQNSTQRDNLWLIRESIPEAQRRAGGSLKHDVAVPVGRIPELLERGTALAEQLVPLGFVVAYGHAGDGNLHFNINQKRGTDASAFKACELPLKRALHDLVAELGGSFSAEHGIGMLKVGELERYASPAKLATMRRIKSALDPNGILNPGKVLG
jgi:FAD/FMN-containing dehydrogenase